MNDRDKYDEQTDRLFDAIYQVIDEPRRKADQEAQACKAQGDMYGWNFHKGRNNGMTEVDLGVREVLRPVVAAALREARDKVEEQKEQLEEARRYNTHSMYECYALKEQLAIHDVCHGPDECPAGELERINNNLQAEIADIKAQLAAKDAEIAKLVSQVVRCKTYLHEAGTSALKSYRLHKSKDTEIADLKAKLAEAEKRGMERARRVVMEQRCERDTPWDLALASASVAIRAEIEKEELAKLRSNGG